METQEKDNRKEVGNKHDLSEADIEAYRIAAEQGIEVARERLNSFKM